MTLVPLVALGQPAPVRITVPTVTVTAQKEPADIQTCPSASRRHQERRSPTPGSISSAKPPSTRRTRTSRTSRPGRSVSPASGDRIQPGQPRDHHLHRRRPAAQHQFVEHRFPGRGPGGARAWTAERAVRPQHAWWPRERDERPAVAGVVDRQRVGAVWKFRGARGAGRRVGAARREAGGRLRRGAPRSRWLYHERPDGQRSRLSIRNLRQGAGALDACRQLGGARHRQRRAGEGRRPGAERPRGAARESVPGLARLRGPQRSRHPVDDGAGAARGAAVRLLEHHRVRQLDDPRCHRPRLHAGAARDARQRRRRQAVHPGDSRRVGGQRASHAVRCHGAEMAGGTVRVHAGLRAGRRQQSLRRSCSRRSWVSR